MLKRLAVALSGGMDSLLALAILAEQGRAALALHGVFFPPGEANGACAASLEALCRDLGVPLHVVDLQAEFRSLVMDPFVEAWRRGETPNPCAHCNPAIKFGLLLDRALALGADGIATGHYARVQDAALRKGLDPAKDQSYFLSLLPRQRLSMIEFPLGEIHKRDVPAMLRDRGLSPPVARESQEICFVPDDDYRAFLQVEARRAGRPLPGPGPILGPEDQPLGVHQGLWNHTLGQRRGLGVAWREPLYVIDKDLSRNALLVAGGDRATSRTAFVRSMNALVDGDAWPDILLARTRYRQQEQPAQWRWEGDGLRLEFLEPQPLPAPGQIAVLYDDAGRVLGGGVLG